MKILKFLGKVSQENFKNWKILKKFLKIFLPIVSKQFLKTQLSENFMKFWKKFAMILIKFEENTRSYQ